MVCASILPSPSKQKLVRQVELEMRVPKSLVQKIYKNTKLTFKKSFNA